MREVVTVYDETRTPRWLVPRVWLCNWGNWGETHSFELAGNEIRLWVDYRNGAPAITCRTGAEFLDVDERVKNV